SSSPAEQARRNSARKSASLANRGAFGNSCASASGASNIRTARPILVAAGAVSLARPAHCSSRASSAVVRSTLEPSRRAHRKTTGKPCSLLGVRSLGTSTPRRLSAPPRFARARAFPHAPPNGGENPCSPYDSPCDRGGHPAFWASHVLW